MKDYEQMDDEERSAAIQEFRSTVEDRMGSMPAQVIVLALAPIVGEMCASCAEPVNAFGEAVATMLEFYVGE